MSHVVLENVEKDYDLGRTKVKALKGINLNLDNAGMVGLIGPSGSGKSTLLNLLGCIDVPTAGHVSIGGRKTGEMSDNQLTLMRRAHIGFIFQVFNLLPVLSAFENVELPLLLLGVGKKEREIRVREMLEWVGLRDVAAHKPDELSGGQRQRVAVCRALVTKPGLVLADEPTASLDWENGHRILQAMRELSRKTQTLIIISTHDPRVFPFLDRRLYLEDGQVVRQEENRDQAIEGAALARV